MSAKEGEDLTLVDKDGRTVIRQFSSGHIAPEGLKKTKKNAQIVAEYNDEEVDPRYGFVGKPHDMDDEPEHKRVKVKKVRAKDKFGRDVIRTVIEDVEE